MDKHAVCSRRIGPVSRTCISCSLRMSEKAEMDGRMRVRAAYSVGHDVGHGRVDVVRQR